jgi:hypothetical protein
VKFLFREKALQNKDSSHPGPELLTREIQAQGSRAGRGWPVLQRFAEIMEGKCREIG